MAKHEKSFVDFDKPYEQNLIGMRGIIIFGVGLFLLIVITFGLMWVLEDAMEGEALESKGAKEPMAMTEQEKLPPEPRLQSAPGFGVNGENGRINLELREPQAEYREIRKIWEKGWQEGQKDPHSGTIVSLPIEEAKKKYLEQSSGMKTDENAAKLYEDSRRQVSASSSGRTSTDKIR
jgi:hypothetical protein